MLLTLCARVLRAALLTAAIISMLPAQAADLEKGRVFYRPCASCHGLAAEGDVNLNAPSLAALPSWYIAKQFGNFKLGYRGVNTADQYGLAMRMMTQSIGDEQQLQDVIAFIASMPAQKPARTLSGDPLQGKQTYDAICRTCHGGDGNGNETLGAPRLKLSQDWYLLRSINNYRDAIRGTATEDFSGQMMAEIARSLRGEQQILDVIAYVVEME